MQFEKIHNKGQARLFRNQYLEYLTKTHPLVIWAIYAPVICLMIYYSYTQLNLDGVKISLVFFAGIFFWTLFEYLIHRYVFHFMARTNRATKFVYLIHGNHHVVAPFPSLPA